MPLVVSPHETRRMLFLMFGQPNGPILEPATLSVFSFPKGGTLFPGFMVSNKFSKRRGSPRPPVVCRAPPKPPPSPIQLQITVDNQEVIIYGYVGLRIFACHAGIPKGQPYTAEWDAGCGHIDPYPDTNNCEPGLGVWYAPGEECTCTIKVKVTWTDGCVAYTSVSFTVVED